MSICIINVGNTGTGKTTETKNILCEFKDKPFLIYDVNLEFTEFYKSPLLKFKDFLNEAVKKTNTVIVFEEATIFFKHNGSTDLIAEMLVRKRHTNNTFIFNFHALHQVPIFILDFANYLILRQTNDVPSLISKKFESFEKIFQAYEYLQANNNKFEKQFIKLN